MLEGYGLTALLLAIGVILLVGELLLPTHGMLGVVGVSAALTAVAVAAMRSPWAGLLLAVALMLLTPVFWSLALRIWPRTPIGRKVLLPEIDSTPPAPPVTVGQAGVVVSELRPMGICEFPGGVRVEALSEHGIVEPGKTVTVVALVNNRPMVRVA
jgi:membrane-bound ClpP family serine protease